EVAPQTGKRLAVGVVERLQRMEAPFLVVRGLENHADQELAWLHLRVIAVLQDLDPGDRGVGETLADLLAGLLGEAVNSGLVHAGSPQSFSSFASNQSNSYLQS